MVFVKRFSGNPILAPERKHPWEHEASFNGCPVKSDDGYHLLYRAQSLPMVTANQKFELSTIGHAISFDRVHFLNRRQLIVPSETWDKFGCEDPRVTEMNGTNYIFYTGIASWPPKPSGISAGLALTDDFRVIKEKHHITPFNAKAMTMFPEKINNKMTVLLTVNPDHPPSTIAIAQFDESEDLWNQSMWGSWHKTFKDHAVPLLRSSHDHVEIGAPPIKIPQGWLLIYSYIKSYQTSHKFFTIEAALLDGKNPQKILGVSRSPLLFPEMDYENEGKIPNIVFPSGALIFNNMVGIYYGASDTTTCLATCDVTELLADMSPPNPS